VTPLIFAASLAICHEEIPIGYPGAFAGVYGRSPYGGNLLLAPYEIAPALKQAGFDRCTTSSNHSNDVGTPGIDSTLDVLDSMGISHVGTARTPAESAIALFTVNGVRVAHLGYTNYSNTVRPPSWEVNQPASVQDVIDDVNEARAMGAEVVIVSLHLGHELEHEPIPDDRAFVTELTAATKVDLVVEHGPHVIQPIEQVNGTWVYWSIGNFLDGMGQPGATRYGPDTLDGLIAWARFTEVGPNHFEVTPSSVLICDEIYGRVVYPALTTLQDPSISPQLRSELQECVARTLPLVPDIS
jgi:poly-gamma-glutamate capsule biosynthesis protein CapA/YwtB (metallophosphatase superfamily)